MNSNLAKVGKPTRWPPGKSGNPAGKPPGTRTAFSQGFIRDFALVWAEEGLEAVRKVAKKSPEAFVAIAARICPNDVRLTLEQAIPAGMSLEDYSLMREVIAAIREGLPDADQMQPGQVFQHHMFGRLKRHSFCFLLLMSPRRQHGVCSIRTDDLPELVVARTVSTPV